MWSPAPLNILFSHHAYILAVSYMGEDVIIVKDSFWDCLDCIAFLPIIIVLKNSILILNRVLAIVYISW